jgi:hypothetical protein
MEVHKLASLLLYKACSTSNTHQKKGGGEERLFFNFIFLTAFLLLASFLFLWAQARHPPLTTLRAAHLREQLSPRATHCQRELVQQRNGRFLPRQGYGRA